MTVYTKIACPHCNKPLKIPEGLAGKTRTCPYCHGTVKIPGAASESGIRFPDFTSITSTDTTPPVSASASAKNGATQSPSKAADVTLLDTGSASSDIPMIPSGLLGLAFTVLIFLATYPLRWNLFGQLFWDRGVIPYFLTFAFGWAVAILIMKARNLKIQKECMLLDVLPTEISEEISLKSLDRFVNHIRGLPGASSSSFLINRVLRGIEHFRVRKSAAETVTMMESQAGLDANNVMGSYSLAKVLLWSLPILGFIGTVLGLSVAVASLGASLAAASDMKALKGAMNDVFSGLGTAFDTTLLALVLSMIVKIPQSSLQKSEEDLLGSVDEYCNENFLRRLNDGREGGAERGTGGGNTAAFREAVEAAMGTHHAELEKWLHRLDSMGGKLTAQMAQNFEIAAAKMQEQQREHATELQSQLSAQFLQIAESAQGVQTVVATAAQQAGQLQAEVHGSLGSAQNMLIERFDGIGRGLESLNDVLIRLGERSVVIQQVPRSGWGKWFGGK
ncbi:MotA/TolQ/ExbB proton channel family protein [Planctomicrobium sp. SH527]|uniref:MotA/TolQ/ExbB proton channel family protein n=1 Tax=Planctomicrobium sp. SH527 TaxID=3448123 RepID=UPI003F5AE789